MAEILRVEDLTKYFATKKGTLHAVDGVTFGLREGQTLGIVGESRLRKVYTGPGDPAPASENRRPDYLSGERISRT